ncbi:helix-turn-helix transcriptional regulator [Actinoplanes sp. NPDC048967]|uniref:helix-turn-helix domain-containing protein n=1 Tax=Actinoplanes sp. NPDC048967 TaxID=3155269 RepID=UPI0033D5A9CB
MMDGGKRRLGDRLRGLRERGFNGEPVTQGVVARAFHKSVPLISSWEKGKAVPSEDWLTAYARLFAGARAPAEGRLPALEELDGEELDRFEQLRRELLELRSATPSAVPAGQPGSDELTTRSPWEGLWHFADRSPITLVCARLRAHLSPESPDYVELYAYSDLDALMELYGHVCAANPGVPVHRKLADELDQSDVTNHLVLLGGIEGPMTRRVTQALNLPVTRDRDAAGFRVVDEDGHSATFRSKLEGTAPDLRLVEDVAHFCRAPNPFNRMRSVTICNGAHGRGTYAAVRTLTDPRFRDRNRNHLQRRYGPGDTYSILARVTVVAGEVITPDWTQDGTVLHEWRAP